jgi:hypothetical protein
VVTIVISLIVSFVHTEAKLSQIKGTERGTIGTRWKNAVTDQVNRRRFELRADKQTGYNPGMLRAGRFW